MLSINVSATDAKVFNGTMPVVVDTNDFGIENRGRVVTHIPEDTEHLEMEQLTADYLLSHGAVKMTANFAYEGDEEYNIRFRIRADQFQGHSITEYGISAASGLLILWEDENGIWWNVRRTGWGGQFTGGTETPGWFYPATHDTLGGTPYPVFTFDINKETAKNFAAQDFYIVFLDEVPFRTNEHGETTDYQSGYVITYQAELPDSDGHFHNFKVLASAATYIRVPQTDEHHQDNGHGHSHDEDDCDDNDDNDDHGHNHHH
jgi:hypothetical protein